MVMHPKGVLQYLCRPFRASSFFSQTTRYPQWNNRDASTRVAIHVLSHLGQVFAKNYKYKSFNQQKMSVVIDFFCR